MAGLTNRPSRASREPQCFGLLVECNESCAFDCLSQLPDFVGLSRLHSGGERERPLGTCLRTRGRERAEHIRSVRFHASISLWLARILQSNVLHLNSVLAHVNLQGWSPVAQPRNVRLDPEKIWTLALDGRRLLMSPKMVVPLGRKYLLRFPSRFSLDDPREEPPLAPATSWHNTECRLHGASLWNRLFLVRVQKSRHLI
jgi:hypothetical protein